MASSNRLANLPGYDTAPDIYASHDTADDSSTLLTSPRSAPASSDTSADEDEVDDDEYGVNRRRLYPERARSRFGATSGRVDTRRVDLSDRVDGRRQGYRVGGSGSRPVEAEKESLEARIARLRREVEECRVQAEQEGGDNGDQLKEDGDVELQGLSRLLAGIDSPGVRTKSGQQWSPAKVAKREPPTSDEDVPDEQTLARVADFDTRLATLEQALGVSSLDTATPDATSTPVIPSLTLLDQQLSALTSATSLASLEAATARIQKLRADTEELSSLQSVPGAETNGDIPTTTSHALTQEDWTKLQALYNVLPTLQTLSPTVPAILNRLRSLRTLHTGAATAASELDELEKRQAAMDKELDDWREGLKNVELAVGETSEANGRNGRVVEGWVKELEGRMTKLGR